MSNDGVHPNDAGQEIYFETVKAVIDDNVAASTGKMEEADVINADVHKFDNFVWYDASSDFVLSDEAEFCYKVNDFWHPNDEGGMAWNDPEIGIEWPELKGEYKGNASAEGYTLEDGTALNLSDKDQKWLGLKDTFKF